MRDSARHAGLAEGRRELASDLYWRYRGVVKAGENEAGHRIQPALMFSFLCSVLCFRLDSIVFWTQLCFMFPSDSMISSCISHDFLDICFMFHFHYSLCFPCMHYVSLFHFLRLCSSP